MKNCRGLHEKFKKKIAELLSAALAEAADFAAEYAPIERKKTVRAPVSQAPNRPAKREVEVFGENSPEFAEAMKKISPGLLALIRDQFKCDPDALVRGAFQDDDSPATSVQKQETGSMLEDDQTMQELEEGDD